MRGILTLLALLASPVLGAEPVLIEGWTLHVSPKLTAAQPDATVKAIDLLRRQLASIHQLVPAGPLAQLQRVPLWFNPAYADGRAPRAEYHPDAGWLRANGRDPAMAKAIEFTNIPEFERECRRMPYFVLHELAHAYHDQVLGFDHPEILAAFEDAKVGGLYNDVERWSGLKTSRARAYALTNAREYFAESTEAYFGRNDFQPYDRAELLRMDPTAHTLLERLWNPK